MRPTRIFDLHCDTLTECHKRGAGLDSPGTVPHFALSRIPEHVRWIQCMAVFMPDDLRGAAARDYFRSICKLYRRELARLPAVLPVTEISRLEPAATSRLAVILTVEGASVLAGELSNLDWLYEQGVRMMTLTWNAANEIAGGADTEEGFTPFGRKVVAGMERLGMAVDVSHLSDRAFWELCEFAQKPFAASHSNARAVCAHRRNLTDDMFREIARRGGVVGLNYSDWFIREGGGSTDIADLLRHVHHLLELDGEDVLALGSDYDGTDIPPYLDGPEKIGNLVEALENSGISSGVVHKILYGNATRFFEKISVEHLCG